jgi:hypothetical protein
MKQKYKLKAIDGLSFHFLIELYWTVVIILFAIEGITNAPVAILFLFIIEY